MTLMRRPAVEALLGPQSPFRSPGLEAPHVQGSTAERAVAAAPVGGTLHGGKAMAQRIASMWESLALEHRAWDLLESVLTARHGERSTRLGRLYDLWVSTRYNVGEMRRLLSDVDLEPLVESWRAAHCRGVSAGYAEHVIVHVRWLLPEGES